ncbi:precorrin-2 C(20)-methyltransferase [Bacteroides pyogenes]|uniref:precorrin-2 C(20)-methyltransferase n=1 Tax=Bacteroides pyogenes TaxID=310300 RepID=UPI0011E467B9|nr:precorrin-2 C(20)-methyltransferase [Bacteroides pyogenes]MBR8708379.1 Precorrin-2 C(20)-methyltransferase [Bacteroides pyogenes]MBR8716975.1 Precorrin-2 C(20)-methyltransferase [Bacteroides pyogenes]MBR8746750.1 Precorrin-2 C(20)-methyltransferase [Bacteroides pyogenes]MBR8757083.1 Precorrin-2 C(20)-methyltransferase [Bacteroides pyogenes]MBR8780248.1 Precorrin-2 C(20)-methyltransferase [Bacteroides pyogenes]
MTHRSVYIVSLGPGDPGLIALHGADVLRRADIVFCPETKAGSRSADFLKKLGVNESRIRCYQLPMNKERAQAYAAYDRLFEEVVSRYSQGECVAVVAEGDAGFYSSTRYLSGKLKTAAIPVVRIAGIPAFIAAAASVGLPLTEQEERLTVYPGRIDAEMLRRVESGAEVAVVMKLSQCEPELKRLLRSGENSVWHYFENVGSHEEFYTCDKEQIAKRTFPYFSLLIIKSV